MALNVPDVGSQIVDQQGRSSGPLNAFFNLLKRALLLDGTIAPGDIIIFQGGNNGGSGGASADIVRKTANLTNHAVVIGGGTNQVHPIASLGTTGQVLTSQGASAEPIFAAVSAGTVTTTGSPTSGNLTKFSGATSITNADLTGDVTTSGGVATTLANSGVSAGTYTEATITVDAKGRVTAASSGADDVATTTLIGLDRLLGDGSTTAFSLADLAEYVVDVSDAGSTVDPALYTLSSDLSQVTFSSAPTAGHVLTFEYVVAQV